MNNTGSECITHWQVFVEFGLKALKVSSIYIVVDNMKFMLKVQAIFFSRIGSTACTIMIYCINIYYSISDNISSHTLEKSMSS